MIDPTINDAKLDEIIKMCKNRMDVSYFKYGSVRDNFLYGRVDAIGSLDLCVEKYKKTKNTEYLLDVINYAIYRIMYPMPDDYFKATDGSESAGVDGIPINMEE